MLPEDSSAPIDELPPPGSSANHAGGCEDGSSSAETLPVESKPLASQSNPDGRNVPNVIALSVPGKIDIQLHNPPEPQSRSARWGKFLKEGSPIATSFFSLMISLVVFYYGHQISKQQNELKEKEVEVAEADLRVKQVELKAKQSELRQKVFAELNEPQETLRTLAAIRLAEYGEDILDPIRMALGVEQEKIQAGAVKVIFHIFRSGTVPREKVFSKLKEFMVDRNPHLRIGALKCLIEICEELTTDEKQQPLEILKARHGSEAELAGQEDEGVVLEVTNFFGYCLSDNSTDFLLGVIRNCPYENPRNQAALHMCKVAISLPVERRDSVVARLKGLLEGGTVSNDLAQFIKSAIEKIKTNCDP